ncbi:hypothetical protein SEEE3402_11420 [Salmonella enterica subsp. enterica serovar Enteritidis str. 3402]|nr:hypothetical protein SEEE3402_11420 [Salmonella enterica subsp. enterica serovar Enteritidis str. 3402]
MERKLRHFQPEVITIQITQANILGLIILMDIWATCQLYM